MTGHLWHFDYPLADGSGVITVATTRPETMLGDTAVAVHPDDPRYRELIGREVLLPIVERRIPVIADQEIDPRFGTGAVKVTPAHDPLDFEIGRRHGLPAIEVIQADGRMTDDLPNLFAGRDRFEVRKLVVREFERLGLLRKTEPHTHAVGHCYRCDTVVEPRLSEQWFVRMAPLAAPALAAYRSGAAPVHPRAPGRGLRPVDGEHPRLVHLPAALVGAPDSRLVLRGPGLRRRPREPHRPRGLPRLPRAGAPGRGCARHLVQLLAGADEQPGLARPDRGPRGHSTPATPWSPRRRSSSSGWPGW